MIFSAFPQQNEAEVIDMFDYFFSQEYTTHCLMKEAREKGLEEGVSGLINYLQKTGHTREDTWHQMKSIYSLSDEKIEEYLNRYWKA